MRLTHWSQTFLKFSSLAILAAIVLSCRRQTDQVPLTADQARRYLQPLLHSGEYATNIVAKFGPPNYQYETGMHELAMYFYFSDHDQAALAAGVGGFTGFFTNNQLAHWEPIYER